MNINYHCSAVWCKDENNQSDASNNPQKLRSAHHGRVSGIGLAIALLLVLSVRGFSQTIPAFPSEFFQFPPGFVTYYDSAPISYTTNLISVAADVAPYYGNILIIDSSNLSPAFLEYFVQDTNWTANLNYAPAGSAMFFFEPNWASVSQAGTGPGERAYLLAGGDWGVGAPNGFFSIFADAGGSNIWFQGVGAGVTNTYASAAISWSSNSWHQIGVEWTAHTSQIYLDGALADTGTGVSIVPTMGIGTNGFYTNSFWLGSDNNGFEQARGAFWNLDTWTVKYGGWYANSNGWLYISNALATWQASLGGGGFGGMMGMGGLGGLIPTNGCGCGCVTNTAPYLTHITNFQAGSSGVTFTFTIENGVVGIPYDVFAATNLVGDPATNSPWAWLGQGTNCGTYTVVNQPTNASFYILGGTNLASDSSGFTSAFESLVIQGNPFTTNSGTPAVPLGWIFSLGLIPNYNYLANSGVRINYSYDPVGRVDLVTGIRTETLTVDAEGNVLSAH